MAGTFSARTRQLQEEVGDGDLEMKLTVHQPYAAAEHVRYWYSHDDGMAGYVETPYEMELPMMMMRLAAGVLGGNLRGTAIDVVQMFEDMVQTYAPTLSSTLKNSCNLDVLDKGALIYHKEQTAPFRYDKE